MFSRGTTPTAEPPPARPVYKSPFELPEVPEAEVEKAMKELRLHLMSKPWSAGAAGQKRKASGSGGGGGGGARKRQNTTMSSGLPGDTLDTLR